MSVQRRMWNMPATVIRWVDGDTLHVNAQVMPGTTQHAIVRVYGIDTPEVGQPNHDEALKQAQTMAQPGRPVMLGVMPTTDKWGRWLATVYSSDFLVDIGDSLIGKGLAVAYFGGTKGVAVPSA